MQLPMTCNESLPAVQLHKTSQEEFAVCNRAAAAEHVPHLQHVRKEELCSKGLRLVCMAQARGAY